MSVAAFGARNEKVEPDPALRSEMLHSRFTIVISSFAVTSSTLEKGYAQFVPTTFSKEFA